jgi:hypothetical protein
LFHVEAEAFGQHSLGLFDRDPTVQGALKLYVVTIPPLAGHLD